MKKMIKKLSGFLAGIVLVGTLSACAAQFDASAYLKALLDNLYYDDPTEVIAQGIGTEEEAAALNGKLVQSNLDTMFSEKDISDELYEEYRQLYKDLYAGVKYTVGEAAEVDEETFEVAVTYQKMHVFVNAMSAFEGKIDELVTTWTDSVLAGGEIPTDEQMNEELFITLKNCMKEALANATYDDAETMTIKVELVDDTWTPNGDDIEKLSESLFDFEGLFEFGDFEEF